MTKSSSRTPKKQIEKFKDAARATGCDEDEAAFEERLRKIAKAVPEPKKSEKKKERSRG